MQIKKDGEYMVVKVPLKQDEWDIYTNEKIGEVDNLIGVCVKKSSEPDNYKYCKFSINHLINLSYKDSIQLGNEIVILDTEEELRDACKELGIGIWEYDVCVDCGEPLYGSFTLSDRGYQCFSCQLREEKIEEEDKKLTESTYEEAIKD